jgi:hypothetical protein
MPLPTCKFEARWDFMSGDERVAFRESRRDLRAEAPDETAALRQSFRGHHQMLERRAAQRARFRAYRATYLTPPPVTTF